MNNNYDLKLEMLKDEKYEKSRECVRIILEKTKSKLTLEEIFSDSNSYQLERYLLFKAQGRLGCGFDCDTTKIATDFFNHRFGYKEKSMDTLISMQYIWGGLIRKVLNHTKQQVFDEDSYEYNFFKQKYGSYIDKDTQKEIFRIDNAQKFIYQFVHLDEIKNKINEKEKNLYNKFCKLAVVYHTIGNISPCPSNDNYNKEKGSIKNNCYDRLDLFMKIEKFKKNKDWLDWFKLNSEKYMLEPFMKDLGKFPEEIGEYANYIDTITKIILERGTNLLYQYTNNIKK